MHDKFLKNIQENEIIKKKEKIIIGYSGGADSSALLFLLNQIKEEYNLDLFAVHINHMLRGAEAERDSEFAEKICRDYNIKLFLYKENCAEFARENKITEEEAGRIIRYKAFFDVLEKENAHKIAVAHNKNDQAETLLMRFIRGTGIKGLSGMDFLKGNLIRPLLNISRNEIEKFCAENKIKFINDSSNTKNIYTRNKIRNELIPLIEEKFNPNFVENISDLSAVYREEDDFLQKNVCDFIKKNVIIKEAADINLSEFEKLHIAIKRRVIRNSIDSIASVKDISFFHIEKIIEISKSQNGKYINLPNNIIAVKNYDFLSLMREQKRMDFDYDLNFENPVFIKELDAYVTVSLKKLENTNKLFNVYTNAYSYDKIKNVIQFRTRREGDIIYLNGHHKKLKKFFIELKIPKFERDKIPLLADGKEIISIFNIKDSDYYKKNDYGKIFYFQIWKDSGE